MSPNKEHLRFWVEDLEDDKHQQTTGTMCRTNDKHEPIGYCCLGRLSEIAMEHGVPLRRIFTSNGLMGYDNDGTTSWVSPKVSNWLAVNPLHLVKYAHMNDVDTSFKAIAAQIRRDFDL